MKDSPNFRGHLSQSCLNTRRKQLHRGPHSECPKPCGFREAGKPGESTLGPIFTPGRRDQTGRNSGVRGTRNPLLERPFTLTHIHEICTKFNEGYTLHRMVNYAYASGNRSVRSTQAHSSGHTNELSDRRFPAANDSALKLLIC